MKKWYLSKTLWANAMAVIAAILATQGVDMGAEMQATTVAFAMGIANIVLRMVTKDPIEA